MSEPQCRRCGKIAVWKAGTICKTCRAESSLAAPSCSANEIDEPWYESEDCEDCIEAAEEEGMDYEHNMTWEDGAWTCDHCGSVQ